MAALASDWDRLLGKIAFRFALILAPGKAIRPGEPKEVKPGERFFLGNKSTMFEITLL